MKEMHSAIGPSEAGCAHAGL